MLDLWIRKMFDRRHELLEYEWIVSRKEIQIR